MEIKARIVADSMAPNGCRITTFELEFPRIILCEWNTHRQISRNTASSRAIPVAKMIELIRRCHCPLGQESVGYAGQRGAGRTGP